MKLEAYLARVYDTMFSQRGAHVELYDITRLPEKEPIAIVEIRLRFWNESMLRINEKLVEERIQLRKLSYVYHYQQQDGSLIFRYDNATHYPDISTYPHHKHVRDGAAERVEATQPPQLTDVLREIDALLAASERQA